MTANIMTEDTLTLALRPLDVLFFRDGRPFGAAAQVGSGLPTPQTVAGALRSWLLGLAGCRFDALGAAMRDGLDFAEALADQPEPVAAVGRLRFRGTWFARDGDDGPLLPAPLLLRRAKGEKDGPFTRLVPIDPPPPGWTGTLRPLLPEAAGALESVQGYLTLEGMAQVLNGRVPEPATLVKPGDLYGFDRRVSVAISGQTGTGRDGQIFTARFLALTAGTTLVAEIIGPRTVLAGIPKHATLALGGEGRRVAVTRRAALA